jgi:hypothetical protein
MTLDPNPALDGSDHDADGVEPLVFYNNNRHGNMCIALLDQTF